ncbi:MAG: (d)CMP kinase [Clostridia bacterium]|nr:(d)CMP kinase [Clostridia bacterium]MDD4375411.1 (d)CMP kinase [Clostridia bacterium]
MNNYIIAVDGPSAAGKSFLSEEIANRLGIIYIDTGAMYRAVALYFIENNVDMNNDNDVQKALDEITIKFKRINNKIHTFLNGEDISLKIRTEQIGMMASKVSAIKRVREEMIERQRNLAKDDSVILDGRDIGSVVFPNANLKVFLTADVEERAKRRLQDLKIKNPRITYDEVLNDIKKRDNKDINKPISPLIETEDSIRIDTTSLAKEEVVNEVIRLLKERDVL